MLLWSSMFSLLFIWPHNGGPLPFASESLLASYNTAIFFLILNWKLSLYSVLFSFRLAIFRFGTKMTTDTIALLQSLAQPVTKTLSGFPVAFDAEAKTLSMTFETTTDFAHTNGTIVQGGFVTAMLDMTMAHLVMGLSDAALNPISLDINTSFVAPCPVGAHVCTPNLLLLMTWLHGCLLYTSPSPRDLSTSRMPSSA